MQRTNESTLFRHKLFDGQLFSTTCDATVVPAESGILVTCLSALLDLAPMDLAHSRGNVDRTLTKEARVIAAEQLTFYSALYTCVPRTTVLDTKSFVWRLGANSFFSSKTTSTTMLFTKVNG